MGVQGFGGVGFGGLVLHVITSRICNSPEMNIGRLMVRILSVLSLPLKTLKVGNREPTSDISGTSILTSTRYKEWQQAEARLPTQSRLHGLLDQRDRFRGTNLNWTASDPRAVPTS